MSSNRKQLAVFGYVRGTYHHIVPEAVIKMFVKYYDQDVIKFFQGKHLEKILSLQNGKWSSWTVKFNHNVSFLIAVAPNGFAEETNSHFELSVGIQSMSPEIDYIIVSLESSLYELASSIHHYNYK